jgi:type I restriction enzyme S subunit
MGDPPGDACLYPATQPQAVITADCIKWTISRLCPDARYFVYAVNAAPVRAQVIGITKGVAQLKVSLARFRSVAIPLPPAAEQEQIVAEVERRLSVVSELEAAVAANLKRAERLRKSILERAFSGRLVPQDPSDEPASALLARIRAERAGKQVAAKGRSSRKAEMSSEGNALAVMPTTRQEPMW